MDITAQLVAAQLLGSMWIGGRESRTTIDIVMSAHTALAWCGPILLEAGSRIFKSPNVPSGLPARRGDPPGEPSPSC